MLPAQPNSPRQLCVIQQIIMVSGTVYFIVDVLPHTIIHYDQNDEIYTTVTEINQSETETTLFDIEAYSLIGMWHFTTLQDYVVYYALYYIDLPHSSTMYYILQIRSIMKANSSHSAASSYIMHHIML